MILINSLNNFLYFLWVILFEMSLIRKEKRQEKSVRYESKNDHCKLILVAVVRQYWVIHNHSNIRLQKYLCEQLLTSDHGLSRFDMYV